MKVFSDGTVSLSRTIQSRFDILIGCLPSIPNIQFWGDFIPVLNPVEYVEAIRFTLIKRSESYNLDITVHIIRFPKMLQKKYLRSYTDYGISSIMKAASDHNIIAELSSAWKISDEQFVTVCVNQGTRLSRGSETHSSQLIDKI